MALEHWRLLAACADMDPNLFFPERGTTSEIGDDETTTVEELCVHLCPVRLLCLDESFTEALGTWGGWRQEVRTFVRRPGHGCPWCECELGSGWGRLFCGDECLMAAVRAQREDASVSELVRLGECYARIDGLAARASEINRLRKRQGLPMPEFDGDSELVG